MALILVVDDDDNSRKALACVFTEAGHDVQHVPNGREALSVVLARNPDLIVLDLYMPEMDGGTFLEVIRSYLRLQSIPVIVLTGLSDSPMVERARTLKVNAILVKGKATPTEIVETVQQELHRLPT